MDLKEAERFFVCDFFHRKIAQTFICRMRKFHILHKVVSILVRMKLFRRRETVLEAKL